MARRRSWDSLSSSTQARYTRWAARNNVDARAYYEGGGSLSAARGHAPQGGLSEYARRKASHGGLSPYRFGKLRQAAKGLAFATKNDPTATSSQIIKDALARGMTYDQILAALRQRQANQALPPARRAAVGKQQWQTRPPAADDRAARLYWYH